MKQNSKCAAAVRKAEQEIRSGALGRSGERMLPVRAFAARYGIAPVTAQKAIRELCGKGVLIACGKFYYIQNGLPGRDAAIERRPKNAPDDRIGIHLPKIDNPFFSALLHHLFTAVEARHYCPVFLCSLDDTDREKEILDRFVQMGVKGVITCSCDPQKTASRYRRYLLPTVHIANGLPESGTPSVTVDNAEASRHVARHLTEMGYENFMYVGLRDRHGADLRKDAFLRELADRHIKVPEDNLLEFPESDDPALRESIRKKIAAAKKPLGIFCYHDILAFRILALCEQSGLRVPEEVGIVGFDDLPIAVQCRPRLSSVSYGYEKMAKQAVDLLFRKIDLCGEAETEKPHRINDVLQIRESSARIRR